MLRPSNSATSLGSMDSKGDASTGSEGLYDWTAPRFGACPWRPNRSPN